MGLVAKSGYSLTDAQLLERVQQGDSTAWQTLYGRLFPVVWREVSARINDRDTAEDIVSETFVALLRNLQQLDTDSGRLHGWVRQVARNRVFDWARRCNTRTRVLDEFSANGKHSHGVDPAIAAEVGEERRLVQEVLDRLRSDQRTVLELKYADDLSVREISHRLELTEKSAESLLYRARVEFRRQYESCSKCTEKSVSLTRNSPSPFPET